MIFFSIYMMVYFSLQKIIYMFLLTISPSPNMENLLLSCILTKKKKLIIKILKEVALCMNNIQF